MSEWEHRQIDEDGGMGSVRPERVGFTVFAWGKTDAAPGGWQLWAENPDGDLDVVIVGDSGPWTEEEAKKIADDRLYDEMPMLLASPLNRSARDVLAERQRQIAKGYDAAHDDGCDDGRLAGAAGLIALDDPDLLVGDDPADQLAEHIVAKHTDERTRLVIAAALLIAEIERLDRAALTTAHDPR